MAAPMLRGRMKFFTKRILTVIRRNERLIRLSSGTTYRNILDLHDRGLFHKIFPEGSTAELTRRLSSPQCMYCGFDPTADSLHVGNLLAIVSLLHCQRAGHNAIALVGGATAQIGDPSGKTKDRERIKQSQVEENVVKITENISRVVTNHDTFIWNDKKQLPPFRILNNMEWYKDRNIIEFLSSVGRNFRMGPMLAKHSVQSRLKSSDGMSFTEFTYQIFQSYDWLHLHDRYNCSVQIGGNDQLGNISAGYELVTRMTNQPVFGITVPLITTTTGDKLGKTAGNAVWLDSTKSSPYELYQYFINLPDSDAEMYLNLFTFLSEREIKDVLEKQKKNPEKRPAQMKIAEQVLLLVHGEEGLSQARRWTEALFGKTSSSLEKLNEHELLQLFHNATSCKMMFEPGTTVLEMCMKAGCFPREVDAERIIQAGGLYINHQRHNQPQYVIVPDEHILSNGITLIRVGKKNYYVVKWMS
ncbi:tyrosine--tRNA ligase, mitochondrial-like [Gigantopelta aegis]|uniref:tyrosine--tRNA ligase, mitochondrial-like n=1 Tax=Gigantopelta aegis TaxID=1735272 RepID=UPI001B887654|nr:tyrosine--tRNA ligase, mitochondrial-like [Gigantopelta aegis]